ncbi:hypothetical protein E2C01_061043 [Portunus trituberculatus]|uniref:Uncharacterized protein n=1 Tax=Portunus trituberculatus TaxID=210409 RepID=A0A5B7HDA8_PORTR|nr:hypothetical protein [Portunus trituberculatus]
MVLKGVKDTYTCMRNAQVTFGAGKLVSNFHHGLILCSYISPSFYSSCVLSSLLSSPSRPASKQFLPWTDRSSLAERSHTLVSVLEGVGLKERRWERLGEAGGSWERLREG